jgi:phosphatidylglycerophosphatase A
MKQARYTVAYWLAIWFGCGRFPLMPGTAGTVGAVPLYLLLALGGAWAIAAGALVVTLVGVWAATEVVRATGLKDPQIVCIDEAAGVLITLVAAPPGWKGLLAGVVLFRLFDQFKPFPARRAERLREGWGVVMDDVFAGLWGAAVLLVARRIGLL